MFRLLILEAGVILAISTGAILISTASAAAIFLGGVVYWVPKGFFMRSGLKRLGRKPSEIVVVNVLAGTIGKALIMGVLIVLVIQTLPGLPVPTFIAALGGFYLAGLVLTAFTLAVP